MSARSALSEVLAPLFRTRPTAAWVKVLEDADILCGPLLTYPDLIAEDHIADGDALVTVGHRATGDIRAPRFPGRLSGTPCDLSGPPPPLPGEHSEAILGECGYAHDEIQDLLRDEVISGLSEGAPK